MPSAGKDFGMLALWFYMSMRLYAALGCYEDWAARLI